MPDIDDMDDLRAGAKAPVHIERCRAIAPIRQQSKPGARLLSARTVSWLVGRAGRTISQVARGHPLSRVGQFRPPTSSHG